MGKFRALVVTEAYMRTLVHTRTSLRVLDEGGILSGAVLLPGDMLPFSLVWHRGLYVQLAP